MVSQIGQSHLTSFAGPARSFQGWVRVHCLVGLGKLATVDDTVAMDSVVPFTQDSSWQVHFAVKLSGKFFVWGVGPMHAP